MLASTTQARVAGSLKNSVRTPPWTTKPVTMSRPSASRLPNQELVGIDQPDRKYTSAPIGGPWASVSHKPSQCPGADSQREVGAGVGVEVGGAMGSAARSPTFS